MIVPNTPFDLVRARILAAELLPRCTFPAEGVRVSCAVSGGADSIALSVLAVAAGCRVTIEHVDHGLRTESKDDAEAVGALATWLGVDFRLHTVSIPGSENLEARARDARYSVLPLQVLVGHTADDQAETMVLNLVRGAGAAGLAAMSKSSTGPLRPILGLRRRETTSLCRALGLEPIVDSMNFDRSFRRVQVRQEILPGLALLAQRDVVPILVRQSELFADDEEALDQLARSIEPTNTAQLRAAHRSVARRAIRRWLVDEGVGDGHPPDLATIDRVLAVARFDAKANDLVGGWRVLRTAGTLRLQKTSDVAD